MVSEMTHGDTISQLWRVRRTCVQMLRDREYLISSDDLTMSLEFFQELFGYDSSTIDRAKLTILAVNRHDPADQILVFFPEESKLGVKAIKGYAELMESKHIYRAILVIRQSITPLAAKVIRELTGKFIIEQFNQSELLVNITEHVLVPPHKSLTENEKQDLLQKYKVKESQLPRIQVSDPVARYYGLSKGQVVKIIRPSESAGRYVTYRLVV